MVLSLRMRLRSGRWSGCHVKTCLGSLSGRSHDNLESWIGIFINDRLFLMNLQPLELEWQHQIPTSIKICYN